jgi:tetratricopeptide (TPR) repeat protein
VRTVTRLGSARILGVLILTLAVSLFILVGCGDPYREASALEKKGDLEGAVALYQGILADNPRDLQALTALSVNLLQLKRYGEALAAEQAVAALDAKDAQIRVELGFNYLNHQSQSGKAVEVLLQAATLEPSAKHLTYLAQAQIASGDVSSAESSLHKAIGLDKGYGHAYGVLLRLLEDQERMSEAATLRQAAASAGAKIPGEQAG